MSNSNIPIPAILTTVSSLMGVLALGGGVYGVTNPLAFSETLGITVTSLNSPALPFVSFAAARNIGSGISILALLYTGHRKVVSVLMMCGVTVAMTDAWICAKFDATEGKAAGHAIMGVVAGILGAGMYRYGA